MKPVKIRNITLGEGKPKICVPIVARTAAELQEQAEGLAGLSFDVVEWRADWYEPLAEEGSIAAAMQCLRGILGDTPVLFTIRTEAEGGQIQPALTDYIAWNRMAAEAGADLIDAELALGEEVLRDIITTAHVHGAVVVGSSHDFAKTPAQSELESRLKRMEQLGCDIAKIAVMPQSRADVLELLQVTERMSRSLNCPLITMSMSADGAISRFCGEVFGSSLTFGTAGRASAPGQPDTESLKTVLDIIHSSLN